jgi:fluoride exporter
MFSNILLIGLAGGTGTILRFLVQKNLNTSFPFGTLLVNIIGCMVIGIAWGYFSRNYNEQKQLIILTGFCGGFTTFSSFTAEGLQMMFDQRWLNFIVYTTVSVIAGLVATFIGFKISS